jgi:hypothetical protein
MLAFLIAGYLFLVDPIGELALEGCGSFIVGEITTSGTCLTTLLTIASPLQLSIIAESGSWHASSTQRRVSSKRGSGLKTLATEFFKHSDNVFITEYGFLFLSISFIVIVSSIFFQTLLTYAIDIVSDSEMKLLRFIPYELVV